MKLLLVDDDIDQLELRSLSLAKAGYRVSTACNLQSALHLAAEENPDIAVVDLRMPDEDAGCRLIRGLKTLNGSMRVILLTGTESKRVDTLPERSMVEAVFTKGSATRQLLAHLKDSDGMELREKLAADGELLLEVKVTTRSSKSEVVKFLSDGSLKVKLAAVPEKGKANEELITLMAEYFDVSKDAVELIAGETSQRKRLRIRGRKVT